MAMVAMVVVVAAMTMFVPAKASEKRVASDKDTSFDTLKNGSYQNAGAAAAGQERVVERAITLMPVVVAVVVVAVVVVAHVAERRLTY